MTNRLQGASIAPQVNFEALQTQDGHALLFSIGTTGAFYLTHEESAKTVTGWTQTDLSSDQIKKDFPGDATAKIVTMGTGQSAKDSSVGLAMAVSSATGQHLYLSLQNASSDLAVGKTNTWESFPYDDTANPLSSFSIAKVMFCETAGEGEFIFVDLITDPAKGTISRHYIDTSKASGTYWNLHQISIDLSAKNYSSSVGRSAAHPVDGLYTAGSINSAAQLVFAPVVGDLKYAPPIQVKLVLDSNTNPSAPVIPEAISTARNADFTTDLFAIGGGGLYHFASSNQTNNTHVKPLFSNALFANTTALHAVIHQGVLTLWGKNQANQVYYTSCEMSNLSNPALWSLPVPVLQGINQISPFVNVIDGSNTIFAAGGTQLKRITQDSQSKAKIWRTSEITLPSLPDPKSKTPTSMTFQSYTSTIQVTQANNLPGVNEQLTIAASRRCAVYLNGVYYSLSTTAVPIAANSMGTLTIMEATSTLTGTSFTVKSAADSSINIAVQPMQECFQKLSTKLGTPAGLRAAIVPASAPAKPLVPKAATDADVGIAATAISNLATTFPKPNWVATDLTNGPMSVIPMGLEGGILSAIGDLFNWLESGIEHTLQIIYDAATKLYQFVVTIANDVYTAILDSAEAILGAVGWVLKQLGTVLVDIVKFVEFLFDWGDITLTKGVLHNLANVFLKAQAAGVKSVQQEFDQELQSLESAVAKWSGTMDWSGLGKHGTQVPSASSGNPTKNQSTGSNHLMHHFQNNAHQIQMLRSVPAPTVIQGLIDDLVNAIAGELAVVKDIQAQLKTLGQNFSNMPLEEVLKKLVGILVGGALQGVKIIGDALFAILESVATTILDVLNTPIYIPIISDILLELNVPSITILDLFCWISGAAYTIVYKIFNNATPFPNDPDTQFLTDPTRTMTELEQAFGITPTSALPEGLIPTLPPNVKQQVFSLGHYGCGMLTMIGTFISVFEAADSDPNNPFGTPSGIAAFAAAGLGAGADYLVPKDPLNIPSYLLVSRATTTLQILNKVLFSGAIQALLSKVNLKSLAVADPREAGALIDSLLTVPAFACTTAHLYQLAVQPGSDPKAEADAIIEEVGNLGSYVSRVAYAYAIVDQDPRGIAVMAIGNAVSGGAQITEAALG